jgi:hypothetical protein
MARRGMFWICLLAAVLICVCPAMAATANKTIQITDVSDYAVVADDGYVIYEIMIESIATGKNQTHHLFYQDSTTGEEAEFILTVGSYTEAVVWHHFDVTLEWPNGNISETHAVWTGVSSGSYVLDIQPVFYRAQSVNWEFSVWVNVGITDPLLVEFFTLPADVCTGGDYCSAYVAATSAIPFTRAEGAMGEVTTVNVYQITEQGFKDNIKKYNAWYGWQALTEDAAAWMIDQVFFLIGCIPVFGPMVLSLMGIAAGFLTELIWWILWIAPRILGIILSLEALICLFAVINTPKGVPLRSLNRNIWNYHLMVYHGLIWMYDKAIEWLKPYVDWVIAGIKAMK